MSLLRQKVKERLSFTRPAVVVAIQACLALRALCVTLLRKNKALSGRLGLPSGQVLLAEEVGAKHSGDHTQILYEELSVKRAVPRVNHKENYWYFEQHRQVTIDPCKVTVLKNGHALGYASGRYLNGNRDLIWDLGREHWLYFKYHYTNTRLRFRFQRVSGTVAVVAHEDAAANFSHWLFDVIPQFHLLEKAVGLAQIDLFYITHSGKGFQKKTFEQMGIPEGKIRLLEPDTAIQAETLVIPSLAMYNNQSHQPAVLQWMRDTYLPASPVTKRRRLYLSRADASFRQLTEEAALFSELEALGFERVTLTGVSIEDTARLFDEAEVIVGPFGSALMNLVFCRPGTQVIDIANPRFYNCHHWYLSDESQCDYRVYFGNSGFIAKNQSMVHLTEDISIEVEAFMQFFKTECPEVFA